MMRWSLLGLLAFVTFFAHARDRDTSIPKVKRAFEAADIPKDIDITFDPTSLLEVTFPQTNGNPVTIHAGEQVPRDETAGPPSFRVLGKQGSGPFVVAAIDPDAPTPQNNTAAEIRHFLGGNFFILKSSELGLLSNATPAISGFLQPGPPAGSPAHRYIFLVFNQPVGFNRQTLVTPDTPITNFNISAFAEGVGLGNPIAGTFMLVAPENSNTS